jgi:hypothetical protein
MSIVTVEVNINGQSASVPALEVDGTLIVQTGRFPKIAAIKDEHFIEAGVPREPERLIRAVSESGLSADILSFQQAIDEPIAQHAFYHELDNVAAADTTSFEKWWDRLPQATRKNCRRAERRGVTTSAVVFDEQLARGIKNIYDETPLRQGRRFWHYGKDLPQVIRDNSSYLDRCDFIASHYHGELIGFMKVVYVGRVARIMQLLSCVAHYDKRPMNALIAKAVEVCSQKGMTHLVYSKYQYGNKIDPLMEFKTRNGFARLDFPRYYVALNVPGRIAVACRLHRGALGILPPAVIKNASRLRESFAALTSGRRARSAEQAVSADD